jgi:hypothetical protein
MLTFLFRQFNCQIGVLIDKRILLKLEFRLVDLLLSRETWRRRHLAPTFSDIRLTDGGKAVSPKRRPHFTPRKIPGTHFC